MIFSRSLYLLQKCRQIILHQLLIFEPPAVCYIASLLLTPSMLVTLEDNKDKTPLPYFFLFFTLLIHMTLDNEAGGAIITETVCVCISYGS